MTAWSWIFSFCLLASAQGWAASNVLVLVNGNDSESLRLGKLYLELRGVPDHHLLICDFSDPERISHDEFDRVARDPVVDWLIAHGACTVEAVAELKGGKASRGIQITDSQVKYLVSMRGVPFSVGDSKGRVLRKVERMEMRGDRRDYSAFDSEMAVACWRSLSREGSVRNPLISGRGGFVLMATRLDGPTARMVETRMRQTIEAEQSGLRGIGLVDAQNIQDAGYRSADEAMIRCAERMTAAGMEVIVDRERALIQTPPKEPVAVYYGWYAKDPEGMFLEPGWHFTKGAIAVHLHSLAGRDPRDPDAYWVGPLIERGAVATFGAVNEPYLGGVPWFDRFNQLLLEGRTFGEALYGASPLLSWQTVAVGDPLYRPFKPEKH